MIFFLSMDDKFLRTIIAIRKEQKPVIQLLILLYNRDPIRKKASSFHFPKIVHVKSHADTLFYKRIFIT